jgi:hypothetical protein
MMSTGTGLNKMKSIGFAPDETLGFTQVCDYTHGAIAAQ